MERAYAQALWRIIENGTDADTAVRALHESLVRSGRTALLPKIARSFAQYAVRKIAADTVTLTVARVEDAANAFREATHAFAALNVDASAVATRVDDTLIGGWRIEGREHSIDASYKNHLLAIYSHATNA